MSNTTSYGEIWAFIEFEKEMLKSIIRQIKYSETLVPETNDLASKEKSQSTKNLNILADKAVDKLIIYFRDNYNVKNGEDYADIVDKLSAQEITKIQKKICQDVIKGEKSNR